MLKRLVLIAVFVCAIGLYELFNFFVTQFALNDLFGEGAMLWSMIMATAFCIMDLAATVRQENRLEVWYLRGAWFLAATMNAMLIWWGVSIAMFEAGSVGAALAWTPVIVAIVVWLVRVALIILAWNAIPLKPRR